MGQLVKRQDIVKFQEELNVCRYTYNNRLANNWKPIIYQLRAVVVHLGAVDSGHFVTYRMNSDTKSYKWVYTSDSFVRSAKIDEVLNSCPYMLFYERSVYINKDYDLKYFSVADRGDYEEVKCSNLTK